MADEAETSSELAASVAALWDRVEALARDNEELRRELATRSTTRPNEPVAWIALKAALPPGISYETARSWCERGFVTARKEGGRWLVDRENLHAVVASRMSGAA